MATEFQRRKCTKQERLTKTTFLAILRDTGSALEEYFNGLEEDQWEIISFNSVTRDVCVRVENGVTNESNPITHSVTLPSISPSGGTFRTAGGF